MVDNISKIFDMNVSSNIVTTQVITQPKSDIDISVIKTDKDLQNDYQSSIDDYTELMEQGKLALSEILSIATASQSARFFEASAMMIKTLSETNAGRMDVHEKLFKIKKLKQELGLGEERKPTNTTVFLGSTSELLKQVKPRIVEIDNDEEVIYEQETT